MVAARDHRTKRIGWLQQKMSHNHPMSSNANPSVANNTAAGGSPVVTPQEGIEEAAKYYPPTYDPQRRHCCWTINNWTPDELERARTYLTKMKSCRYICFAQEVAPTTGTPHLQGYVAWTTTMSLQAFKKKMGGRLRFEANTNGTAQQNRDYCSGLHPKKGSTLNPTFEEYGVMPQQGDRVDWTSAVEQIRERTPVANVVFDQPHLTPCIRALERLAAISNKPPKDRDVRVLYIHGSSGCGKTRSIHECFPDAYWKPNGEWWDGYEGESVVVLDDFYGDIQHALLLRVLDRYPLRVPHKGGFHPAHWTTIIISSNASLDEQYPSFHDDKRQPLYRRIHRVIDADSGISPEIITDALRSPPQRPQIDTPVRKAARDDPTEPHYVPRPSSPSLFRT